MWPILSWSAPYPSRSLSWGLCTAVGFHLPARCFITALLLVPARTHLCTPTDCCHPVLGAALDQRLEGIGFVKTIPPSALRRGNSEVLGVPPLSEPPWGQLALEQTLNGAVFSHLTSSSMGRPPKYNQTLVSGSASGKLQVKWNRHTHRNTAQP